MTVTLTCAFCKRQETQEQPWRFPRWYKVIPQDGSMQGREVCSEECLVSWAIRAQWAHDA